MTGESEAAKSVNDDEVNQEESEQNEVDGMYITPPPPPRPAL